jgi:hypothetical protein
MKPSVPLSRFVSKAVPENLAQERAAYERATPDECVPARLRGRFAVPNKNATIEGASRGGLRLLKCLIARGNGGTARRASLGASLAPVEASGLGELLTSCGIQTSKEETTMKNVLTKTVLALALAATAGAPAAFAKPKKPKHSAEHVAAVKKCNEDYSAAVKSAKSLKGKERKDADAKARADHKQCLAAAPM